MVAIALDVGDRAVLQIDLNPATAGAHVTGGGLGLVPGLGREYRRRVQPSVPMGFCSAMFSPSSTLVLSIVARANFISKFQGAVHAVRDWLVHIRKTDIRACRRKSARRLWPPFSTASSPATRRSLPHGEWRRQLGVSRNTVVLAYQGLLDDGYLVAKERSGYYVSEKALDASPQVSLPLPPPKLARVKKTVERSPVWEGAPRDAGPLPRRTSRSRWTG